MCGRSRVPLFAAVASLLSACGNAPTAGPVHPLDAPSGSGAGTAPGSSGASPSGSTPTSNSSAGSDSDAALSSDGQGDGALSLESSSVADGATAASPGDSGLPFNPPFILGADITFTQQDQASGATFAENAAPKPIVQLLKDHGFNYIRLRTFVDPTQSAPNPQGGTFAPYSTQGFGDLPHTIAFGQAIKAAGMGFLLDFHYSDTWADPGKQVKPAAWVNDDFAAATRHVHDYTFSSVQALVAAGARPDMVQIGNEITPGMLLTPGIALGPSTVAGWPQLAQLLKAGISAVQQVDPSIKVMLHIDRGGDLNASVAFVNHAIANGVTFDVLGESCYIAFQGQPSGWQSTFNGLAIRFPNLKFAIAEYNSDPANQTDMELRQANDIVFGLPNHQGMGTFFWEPTRRTQSPGMFTVNRSVYTPVPACISQYDEMKIAYGL